MRLRWRKGTVDYADHDQWTREEMKILKERGQPIITINKIKDKLDLLCGMERKARTDPKASRVRQPRKIGQTPQRSALRYIADDNSFSLIRSQVFECMLS